MEKSDALMPHFASAARVVPEPGKTVIIGAGPAGLSAAHELARARRPVRVLEADPARVGGLSSTIEYRGFRFDIGGHRFFSRNPAIENLWTQWLGARMLRRKRLSRVYYRGKLFKYPLELTDALVKLGPGEAIACAFSYAFAKARRGEVRSFEDWVTRAFGRRLYEIFFKTYTEKVWGIPCAEISADWAAQRIRGLSMAALLRSSFGPHSSRPLAKTLIDSFRYPSQGPGEMWESVAAICRGHGATINLGERVVAVRWDRRGVYEVVTEGAGGVRVHVGDRFISTMPIKELIAALDPPAPPALSQAIGRLRYRDFMTVALILDQPSVFPDQWIYIHEPGVRVGRIQNFKNWSPEMVPDARFTGLGLEYFCSADDELWSASDAWLADFAASELAWLGLADRARVTDATVIRRRAAYPVYDHGYSDVVRDVRSFIAAALPNLQLAGRNGMHKYNNQDHAMLTGLMAAWNIMGARYDPWRVNSDAEYLEDAVGEDPVARAVPMPIPLKA
jgi:protoporphyrinogen oxidase